MCLREPSLGPCLAWWGSWGWICQVIPMEDINLHFTGDFHAITSAHNLLAAMIDNHIYWGNDCDIDMRRVVWRRVLDMNDRALRLISYLWVASQTDFHADQASTLPSPQRLWRFCACRDLADLQRRLGAIIIGYKRDKTAVTCADIKADGAMTVLLKEALQPIWCRR